MRIAATLPPLPPQVWDINSEAPEALQGPFHLVTASNALHTCRDIAGKPRVLCSLFAACGSCSTARRQALHAALCPTRVCSVGLGDACCA